MSNWRREALVWLLALVAIGLAMWGLHAYQDYVNCDNAGCVAPIDGK